MFRSLAKLRKKVTGGDAPFKDLRSPTVNYGLLSIYHDLVFQLR